MADMRARNPAADARLRYANLKKYPRCETWQEFGVLMSVGEPFTPFAFRVMERPYTSGFKAIIFGLDGVEFDTIFFGLRQRRDDGKLGCHCFFKGTDDKVVFVDGLDQQSAGLGSDEASAVGSGQEGKISALYDSSESVMQELRLWMRHQINGPEVLDADRALYLFTLRDWLTTYLRNFPHVSQEVVVLMAELRLKLKAYTESKIKELDALRKQVEELEAEIKSLPD